MPGQGDVSIAGMTGGEDGFPPSRESRLWPFNQIRIKVLNTEKKKLDKARLLCSSYSTRQRRPIWVTLLKFN
jgi:hypothetical protein